MVASDVVANRSTETRLFNKIDPNIGKGKAMHITPTHNSNILPGPL